jgi:PKD repeat protein
MQPYERPPVTTIPIRPAGYAEYPTFGYPTDPAPLYPTVPQPGPARAPWTGLRLTIIALVVGAGAIVMEALLPPSAVTARQLAYPQPAVSIQSDASATTRIGDTITFTATITAGRDLTFSWDFGDGATASGASVTHSYGQYQAGGYAVSLSVVDPLRQSASAQANVVVVPLPPVACFGISKDPNDPLAISVDAGCSSGTNLQYAWDFGDGTQGGNAHASHVYGQPGNYIITLTVTDVANQTATKTQSVALTIAGPVASFIANEDPSNPDCYYFDASQSTGYQIQQYQWDYGDQSGDQTNINTEYHCYPSGTPSYYTVTLTITDAFNRQSTATQSVYDPGL